MLQVYNSQHSKNNLYKKQFILKWFKYRVLLQIKAQNNGNTAKLCSACCKIYKTDQYKSIFLFNNS